MKKLMAVLVLCVIVLADYLWAAKVVPALWNHGSSGAFESAISGSIIAVVATYVAALLTIDAWRDK